MGAYSFMDVDTAPEPPEDVITISTAPADEGHPPGSSDQDGIDGEEQEAESQRKRRREDADEIATLDIDDDLADGEVPLPLHIPHGYVVASSAPAALTAALLKQPIMLRLGVGWLIGVIPRQAQARTRHLYDFRVYPDGDGSMRSMKLPLEKYSVDGASEEVGSWALLCRCEGVVESSDDEREEEVEEEFEEENCQEETREGRWGGSDSEKESIGRGEGGNGVPQPNYVEERRPRRAGVVARGNLSRGGRGHLGSASKRSVRLLDQYGDLAEESPFVQSVSNSPRAVPFTQIIERETEERHSLEFGGNYKKDALRK